MTYREPKLITPAAAEPVAVVQAKRRAEIDDTYHDVSVAGYIAAARSQVELETNRALLTSTWDLYLDAWPRGDTLRLPKGMLQSVTSFAWTLSDGTSDSWTVSGSDLLDGSTTMAHIDTVKEPAEIVLAYGQSWPSGTLKSVNGIVIRFVCGWRRYSGIVSTSGTAVTRVSGDNFDTAWTPQTVIVLDGVEYIVASFDSTTAATLASTAGTLTSKAWSVNFVPDDIKSAIYLLVGHFYAHREAVLSGTGTSEESKVLARGVDHLLANYILRMY